MEERFPLYKPLVDYLGILGTSKVEYSKGVAGFYESIDWTGVPFLNSEIFGRLAKKYSGVFIEEIEKRAIITGDKVYLRGEAYFLGYYGILRGDAIEAIRRNLLNLNALQNLILEESRGIEALEDRVLFSTFLDYQKNYLLLLFTGLFHTMINNPDVGKRFFEELLDYCQCSVNNYYAFVLGGEFKIAGEMGGIEEVINQISPDFYSSRRFLSREMDHPGRVLLYCLNLINQLQQEYEFSLNPLTGAVEIGFALQGLSTLFDKKVIGELAFVEYSRIDRRHSDILDISELVEKYVPAQLRSQITSFKGKDVIIIDDNLGSGKTLTRLSKVLRDYCRRVDLSVVEINSVSKDVLTEEAVLAASDLAYEAIGEWRNQIELIKRIKGEILGIEG